MKFNFYYLTDDGMGVEMNLTLDEVLEHVRDTLSLNYEITGIINVEDD